MGLAIRQGICAECAYCRKLFRDKSDKRYACGNFECKAYQLGPFEHPKDHGCLHYFLQGKEKR